MTETSVSPRPFTSVWSDLQEVEFSQGFIQAGPYRTRYLHAGDTSKPTLVMLHGITGHAEAYVRNLRSHAEHFSCWAIDFIGHGYSDKPDHPLEVKHYIDQVLAFLDAIGVREGLLHRGIPRRLGDRAAGDRPPGAGGADRAEHHGRHDGQPAGDGAALHAVHGGGEGPVLGPGQGPPGVADGRPDHGHRRPDQDPAGHLPAAATGCRRARRTWRCRTRRSASGTCSPTRPCGQIQAPALVLWTTKDPSGPVAEAQRITSLIPGAKLAVMENCGHWPQYEDTETFNKIHLDFLLGR